MVRKRRKEEELRVRVVCKENPERKGQRFRRKKYTVNQRKYIEREKIERHSYERVT